MTKNDHLQNHISKAGNASLLTIGCVILLVLIKLLALLASNSAAVLSSLIDSLGDIGLSAMTYLSIRWAAKPADDNHRHGHGKIEGVAALLQGAVLVGAAAFLVMEGVDRLIKPVPISGHMIAGFCMALSIIVSLFMVWAQNKAIRDTGSVALAADKKHYASDIYINGAALAVILLDWAGYGTRALDPLCTFAIAAVMGKSALGIIIGSFDILMDKELPQATKSHILSLIEAVSGVRGVHDLRATSSGTHIFISFDMEVEGSQSVTAAHAISRAVEDRLIQYYPNAEVMIHLDPEGDLADSRHRDITNT